MTSSREVKARRLEQFFESGFHPQNEGDPCHGVQRRGSGALESFEASEADAEASGQPLLAQIRRQTGISPCGLAPRGSACNPPVLYRFVALFPAPRYDRAPPGQPRGSNQTGMLLC
jgi:hypothetical protein